MRTLFIAGILTLLALAPRTAPAATFDLSTATIADIHAAIDAGALSSGQLVQLYLNRIAAYDRQGPKLNSLITINPNALVTARALDEERKTKGRRSPLHGIPVVVKDLVNTREMQTTGGFVVMKGAVPGRDANEVEGARSE